MTLFKSMVELKEDTNVAEKRWGVIDAEKTEVWLMGKTEVDQETFMVLALPFIRDDHPPEEAVVVTATNGERIGVRMTSIPKNQARVLRKAKPAAWTEGSYLSFGENLTVSVNNLVAAFSSRDEEEPLNRSFAMDLELPLQTPIGDSDPELEGDTPASAIPKPKAKAKTKAATTFSDLSDIGLAEETVPPGLVVLTKAIAKIEREHANFKDQLSTRERALDQQLKTMADGQALLLREIQKMQKTEMSPPRKTVRMAPTVDDDEKDVGALLDSMASLHLGQPIRTSASSRIGRAGNSVDVKNDEFLAAMKAISQTQALICERLNDTSSVGDSTLGGTSRTTRERTATHRRVLEQPLEMAEEWMDTARRECKIPEGNPFCAQLFGSHAFGTIWKDHTTLRRLWEMLSAIHALLWDARSKLPKEGLQALSQTTQCLKATGVCLSQNGQWTGAWEYTHLPPIGETQVGIPVEERAAVGRFMREQAAVEKLLEEQRSASPKK